MPAPAVAPRSRRAAVVVGTLVVLALLLLSHSFGRAEPTGNYRPPMTPDTLLTGCYPLPGDARLDLPHQVRRDKDVSTRDGARRRLQGQYDLVGRDEAEARLVAAFEEVGFTEAPDASGGGDGSRTLRRGGERVTITVTALPGTGEGDLVRGEFVLDLPIVAVARPDDPVCQDRSATKRWVEASWWPW
ncbi:hypothetical protein [Nocardioides sp. J54]|uniref:hypothetical protein n=1 Tax=Nocardioides sp. J54 TaxID=935866 RepID=UPI000490BE0A|nr:hypothetical protein [Nocardioides sp. J54]